MLLPKDKGVEVEVGQGGRGVEVEAGQGDKEVEAGQENKEVEVRVGRQGSREAEVRVGRGGKEARVESEEKVNMSLVPVSALVELLLLCQRRNLKREQDLSQLLPLMMRG